MCGICGIYNYNRVNHVQEPALKAMNRSLNHRGPDDNGLYLNKFIGFGHRRLSIIDLNSGKQPLSNEDNSIWVTYNGEIYNFEKIKLELILKGHQFKTHCDSEIIVHAYEEYGVRCVDKFNGMFAFAIWDENREVLLLARDRLGIKPLYYTITNETLLFASEIKSILVHPSANKTVETNSVLEYLFCTAPLNGNTMFKGIKTLPPGNILFVKKNTFKLEQYWDVSSNQSVPDKSNIDDYGESVLEYLNESVQLNMMSDVPFGSLLSGGLDSSLISAFASRNVSSNLKTFSMDYKNNTRMSFENSDMRYAKIMAKELKSDHTEYLFESGDYQSIIEKVTWHIEKPIELTSPSLFLLYKELKKDVKVVLTGEGADELFGGYFFFLNENKIEKPMEFPWAPYFEEVSGLIDPDIIRETRFKDNIITSLHDLFSKFNSNDHINKVLYLFVKIYLVEMLERQDKCSMAWGVEARVPFLDHRLVDFAMNIPSRLKINNGIEKLILKEVSRAILPATVVDRKKKPFPFPVDPMSILSQKRIANDLVQNGNSKIASFYNKKEVYNFFNRKGKYENIDDLAIFRTSYAMIALENWHNAFGV